MINLASESNETVKIFNPFDCTGKIREALASSSVASTKLQDQAVDLNSLSGHIWTCIDYKADQQTSGYIYTFKLKGSYSPVPSDSNKNQEVKVRFHKKTEKIFPAVERNYDHFVAMLDSESNLDYSITKPPKSSHYTTDLNKLGYSSSRTYQNQAGYYFTAPDRTALTERWMKFRETRTDLPILRVADFEESDSEINFVEKCLENHLVLSRGKSFCHDQLIHSLLAIDKLLYTGKECDKKYQYSMVDKKNKEIIRQEQAMISFFQEKIQSNEIEKVGLLTEKYLELAQVALAIKTEVLVTGRSFSYEDLETDYLWFNYLKQRFSTLSLTFTTTPQLMIKIGKVYKQLLTSTDSLPILDFSDLPRSKTYKIGLSFLSEYSF